ncbi:PaaI family thioesterase [Nitrincola schmidtii]|uniref:PaaI family thioesterase n=1 Tax=Nitrincola schmidtii TaxID=1730894 RepID=UPI001F0DFFD9|nr:PaaI family thioesterase [Nitrincola schmidtii]
MKKAPDNMNLKMNVQELSVFLVREFPQFQCEILAVTADEAVVKQRINESHLRPGGTVSGPTMMALADVALYVAILSRIGPVALAVTTDFTCHFLNKPEANKDLIAKASLLKLGKRLVIGEVSVFSEGQSEPVAHVVATYSIPVQ